MVLMSTVFIGRVYAQNFEVIVDTIYNASPREGSCLLIGKDKRAIVYQDGNLKPFPLRIERMKMTGLFEGYIFQSSGFCYILGEDCTYDSSRYVELDFNELPRKDPNFEVFEDKIAYVRNDSVFVADFNTHESKYIMTGVIVASLNSNFVWMRDLNADDEYMYLLAQNKLVKIPTEWNYPVNREADYFIKGHLGDILHVKDLEMNDVLLPSEGFDNYSYSKGYLAVESDTKSARLYFKNKRVNIDEGYDQIFVYKEGNICLLQNELQVQVNVLDAEGNVIKKENYDKKVSGFHTMENHVRLKKGSTLYLYNYDFELILQGDYKDMIQLDKNVFLVENYKGFEIIRKDGTVILSSKTLGAVTSASVIYDYGTKLIRARSTNGEHILFDFGGSEIVRWVREDDCRNYYSSRNGVRLNVRMVASLTDEQEFKINPSGIWLATTKKGLGRKFYACDRHGNRLTHLFHKMALLDASKGLYLAKAIKGKTGILKISKK